MANPTIVETDKSIQITNRGFLPLTLFSILLITISIGVMAHFAREAGTITLTCQQATPGKVQCQLQQTRWFGLQAASFSQPVSQECQPFLRASIHPQGQSPAKIAQSAAATTCEIGNLAQLTALAKQLRHMVTNKEASLAYARPSSSFADVLVIYLLLIGLLLLPGLYLLSANLNGEQLEFDRDRGVLHRRYATFFIRRSTQYPYTQIAKWWCTNLKDAEDEPDSFLCAIELESGKTIHLAASANEEELNQLQKKIEALMTS